MFYRQCSLIKVVFNKLGIFAVGCSSLTMPNLSSRSRRELSTGLQLQQKDQNHGTISHCCRASNQKGERRNTFDCKVQILNR